jgi:hypothetical protein
VCAAKYAEVLKLADPQFSEEETMARREKLAKWLARGAAVVDIDEGETDQQMAPTGETS